MLSRSYVFFLLSLSFLFFSDACHSDSFRIVVEQILTHTFSITIPPKASTTVTVSLSPTPTPAPTQIIQFITKSPSQHKQTKAQLSNQIHNTSFSIISKSKSNQQTTKFFHVSSPVQHTIPHQQRQSHINTKRHLKSSSSLICYPSFIAIFTILTIFVVFLFQNH